MRAYYNEFDPKAAAWLRELIADGLIMDGDVDERSITEVTGADIEGYTRVHLFAGIGGWDYALQLAGWAAGRPVWTGSCPCQPFSTAGKRRGEDDSRNLWCEMLRLIAECRPATVFGEQVTSAVAHGWIDRVFHDLEAHGYAGGAADLCAAGVGAPHIRQRLYWVGYDIGNRSEEESARSGASGRLADAECAESGMREQPEQGCAGIGRDRPTNNGADGRVYFTHSQRGCVWNGTREDAENAWEPGPWRDSIAITCRDGRVRRIPRGAESVFQRVADGIPDALDGGRAACAFPLTQKIEGRTRLLKGYGNAIVPQLAAEFVKAFLEGESP